MFVEKYGWAIQKNLFAETNQDSTFSHTRENSRMFNITSKYFSFFNNKPPASWVVHIARDFLTCYSCSYYSSMEKYNLLALKKSLFVIFGEFSRNCLLKSSIRCSFVLWISTSVYVTPFNMGNKRINSKTTEVQSNIMPKSDNSNAR